MQSININEQFLAASTLRRVSCVSWFMCVAPQWSPLAVWLNVRLFIHSSKYMFHAHQLTKREVTLLNWYWTKLHRHDTLRGYSHQRRAFFSAVEILLLIYQIPIHLNGARWRTSFWTHREVRRRKKTRNAAAKLHAWLDPWATANENLVSNIMVLLLAHDHILAYHGTSIPTASSVFLLRCECSGTDKIMCWSCADNHAIIFETRFSLAAAHGSSQACNLAAAFRVLFRPRTSRCVQNIVRQRALFKCMVFWYIHSRISAAEKKCVFGVNSPLARYLVRGSFEAKRWIVFCLGCCTESVVPVGTTRTRMADSILPISSISRCFLHSWTSHFGYSVVARSSQSRISPCEWMERKTLYVGFWCIYGKIYLLTIINL